MINNILEVEQWHPTCRAAEETASLTELIVQSNKPNKRLLLSPGQHVRSHTAHSLRVTNHFSECRHISVQGNYQLNKPQVRGEDVVCVCKCVCVTRSHNGLFIKWQSGSLSNMVAEATPDILNRDEQIFLIYYRGECV